MLAPPSFITRDEPLAPRTTLRLGGSARYFTEARSVEALREALAWAKRARVGVAVLGGGSNVVVPDEGVDGLVLRLSFGELFFDEALGNERVQARAGAGLAWGTFVEGCVERELAGVECLAGIPGTVGATPVQNVGAYGQEVSQTVASVRVLDRDTLEERTMGPGECAFAYRDSAFKRGAARRASRTLLSPPRTAERLRRARTPRRAPPAHTPSGLPPPRAPGW